MKLTIQQMRRWINYNRQGLRKGTSTLSHSQRNEFAQVCGLGNGTPTFISYEEACDIVRKAGIKTLREFHSWNRPQGMPSNPHRVYKDSGWSSWPEFLGTGIPFVAMPYSKACDVVRKAGIKTVTEFQSWNRPDGMPSAPHRVYKNSGWSSWPEFFGLVKFVAMPYSRACDVVRKAGIETWGEFHSWNRPPGMPSAPGSVYKDSGWESWPQFLDNNGKRYCLRPIPYVKACKIVRKAGIETQEEFQSWNRPDGMPSAPHRVYKNSGWSSWPEFLGTGFVSYSKACKIVRKAGIETWREFRSWNRPEGMPSSPGRTYKDSGWESWTEFLGTKRRKS